MRSATGYVQILTWVPRSEDAADLAKSLVHARLAAAAQVIGPVQSFYWWRGVAEENMPEWQVQIKTTAELYPAVEAHIKARHGYETPGIVALPILAGSADYLAWISEQTRTDA
ncbi:divalent-cation tolerance protein CutA [Streptosporangiaceae bacterium NEAU-GS5]|nr:divalent-cation tolerance protein CutA [Streptosporangiaceae bacterium NEAU-GS5]